MRSPKTLKLGDLINRLTEYKEKLGDVEVFSINPCARDAQTSWGVCGCVGFAGLEGNVKGNGLFLVGNADYMEVGKILSAMELEG